MLLYPPSKTLMHVRNLVNPAAQRLRRYDTIIRLLQLRPRESVLSVGCGQGDSFERFNATNPITGIDIFPTSHIDYNERFQYVQRTGDDFPFVDNEFDAVVCIGVLEHITNPQTLYATCREIVRTGRKYLVLVPHFWTIVEPHYGLPWFQHLPETAQRRLTERFGLRYAPGREARLYERLNYFPTRRWLSFFPPDACKTTYMHIGPLITNLIIYGGVQSSAVRAADTDVHSKRSSRLDTRVERV